MSLRDRQIEVIAEQISGEFAPMGERLLFTTREPGQDIRVSDGTSQGTHFLLDPVPGWIPDCGIICDPTYNMPNHLHATPAGKILLRGRRRAFGSAPPVPVDARRAGRLPRPAADAGARPPGWFSQPNPG